MPERKPQLRKLRNELKAHLYQMLALLTGHDLHPFRLTASDDAHKIVAGVGPAGSTVPAQAQFPGKHFSPVEVAVWHALASGPLPAKAIARRVEQKYTPTFRAILRNLVDRDCLVHDRETGYAQAGAPVHSA